MERWSAVLVTVTLFAASPARAPADAALDARVRALLGAVDSPASAERWRALGDGAVAPLAAVAADAAALPTRRARAVNALAALGGAQATAVVAGIAGDDRPSLAVRAAALRALPRLVGSTELAARLRPVLQGGPTAPVRAVAAQVLARYAPGTCADVRGQAARERSADRPAFVAAVVRCGGGAP